ncbi:MAG: caspase family protein [Bacteroidetes bacterium]|nr:caspase family protein [Bacteroidota bacterium]
MQLLSLDIRKTKALLIGVSDYQFLPPISPALGNIEDLTAILTDNDILGLPAENIIQVINKRNDEIFDAIVEFLENSDNAIIETLLFYYVGHGIREKTSKKLYLTGINTKNSTITTSAILYNDIKDAIGNSQLQKRIVILDACHSGLATQGENPDVYTEPELDIKGTFVLASSSDSEKSFFDTGGRNTFFTAEIVKLLKNGLVEQKPVISLDDMYFFVKKNLKQSTPRRNTNLDTHDFYLFHNCQYDTGKILEHEADLLFEQLEYENARLKYLEAFWKRQTDELKHKIEECENYIDIKKKILRKEQEVLRLKEETEKAEREQLQLQKLKEEQDIQKRLQETENEKKADEERLRKKKLKEKQAADLKRIQELERAKIEENERIENEKRIKLEEEQQLKKIREKDDADRLRQQRIEKEQAANLKLKQDFKPLKSGKTLKKKIFLLILMTSIVIIAIVYFSSKGPSANEIRQHMIADSIRKADSVAVVQAEQQRIADSIGKARSVNSQSDSVSRVWMKNNATLPVKLIKKQPKKKKQR